MSQTTVPTAKLNNHADVLATNTAPSFAVGGIVTTDMGGYDRCSSVALQADGKILLGGTSDPSVYSQTHDFVLARYNSDGSLDLSFDGDGKVTTDTGIDDYAHSVVVQADGKILLDGPSFEYGDHGATVNYFTLTRYSSDGSLDAGFGREGKVVLYHGNNSAQLVAVQADGKLLLSWPDWYNDYGSTLERYNSDGSPDLSFNGSGMVVTDEGISADLVAVQADGKILLGGSSGNKNSDFTLVRYSSDGSLDLSFGGDGIVTTDLDVNDDSKSVIMQADGKILLGGTSNGNFVLIRYIDDGSLDLSFNGSGIVVTDMAIYGDPDSVTVQADGKILLGGSSNGDFAVVRYNSDGSVDTGFGGDGKVTTHLGGSNDWGNSVAVQADGKILLAGSSHDNFALLRYNSDGSLDTSFNSSNLLSNPSYTENGKAVVLDDALQIHDAELAAQGNYNGASITLARHGGANTEDAYSGMGRLSFNGSDAVLSDVIIGTVSNNNGTLSINFNSNATQARVDAALSSIAYRNTTDYPPVPTDTPVSVQIDWTFNDGNTGAQGTGEALTTTGSSIVNILGNQDEIRGTTGNDYLHYLLGNYVSKIYGFAGNDKLDGIQYADILDGGNGDDTLSGGRGDDTLEGGEGNDTLSGESGKDRMLGGLGDDLYSVDKGSDKVIEKPDEGRDTIISSCSYNLPANVENLTLYGKHSIIGTGNSLTNTLIGNDYVNTLSGGAGADSLTGGLGADIFKFNKTTETGITESTRDSIVDFSHDQGDKINLAGIDANIALKGNNAFAVPTVGGAFSGTFANRGELYFDQTTHILYGNNDADSAADFSIQVMGVSNLVAADFVL